MARTSNLGHSVQPAEHTESASRGCRSHQQHVQALIRPDHLRKKREISLLQLLKTKRKMDQALRKAAIRAYKYLRAMVTQHGSRLQEVYDAAKVHSVAEVQQRRQTGIPLRNMTSQRQRLSCTVHPPCLIHGPQPKLQSTWMAPVSGSLRCVGFSLRMSMLGVPQAHIQLRTS